MSRSSPEEVLKVVRELARRELQIEVLQPSDDLTRDLALDSIQLLTLVVELENRFRVRISQEAGASVATISDLVALVSQLTAEHPDEEANHALGRP